MPQLNFGDFAPQLIWLAVTFAALYVLMSRLALPRIGQVLEARRLRLTNDLQEAQHAQKKAEEAAAQYDAALAEARAKAQASIKAVRDRLDRELDAERSATEARIAERMAAAEREIEASRQQALANVSTIARETVGAIVKQVAGLDVSDDEVSAMVQTAGRKPEEVV